MALQWGETAARLVSQRLFGQQPSNAALTAIPSAGTGQETFNDGQLVVIGTGTATFNLWVWAATSTASAGATVIVPVDAPATGRWLKLV